MTWPAVRQWLHRARERFAKLSRAEVHSVLRTRVHEELEQAPINLGLLVFHLVRFALKRDRRG